MLSGDPQDKLLNIFVRTVMKAHLTVSQQLKANLSYIKPNIVFPPSEINDLPYLYMPGDRFYLLILSLRNV